MSKDVISVDDNIDPECGLPYGLCNLAVKASWFERDLFKLSNKETKERAEEYRQDIRDYLVEQRAKLKENSDGNI